ncbi:MFS transporter [Deinococcus hopiensis]|uniref:MFS transporter, FSR family, fosmidomycin resistance protein n=1 Tax=Deinococcus hopiensis KR-140 TaxID=695939 RepID=A0A1W1VKW9_9DEIO|nr:MFS transporter [Deinococcus hopiensis]SMB94012.1 MFS transporter, FSR family, fosmidomycin resistance protein [Deinococcus hopiensis KR-140]
MTAPARLLRLSLGFLIAALAAELADELVDGATGSAWPLVRADLALSYAQIGLLLGLPAIFANVIEPLFGLLADRGYRKHLVLGGGLAFALSLCLFAASGDFWPLLAALLLFYPASGAFVSLTQAALMDAEPERREQNMARWTLVGSVGNVVGPLLVGLSVTLGLGWRPVFGLLAALTVGALALMWRSRTALAQEVETGEGLNFREAWRDIRGALARADVRRWLLLLEAGNLTADVFRGLVALYFVDSVGASPAVAGLAVTVFTGVGLLGDVLVVPLLERVSGVAYLRVSSLLTALLFPAFFLVPQITGKLVLLGLLGLLNAGWYAVLQARLYGSLPERSGTVMALGSVTGMVGGAVPLALGWIAGHFGLEAALWCLLAGPLSLLLGLPRKRPG